MNQPELSAYNRISERRLNVGCQGVVATIHRPTGSIEDSYFGRNLVGQLFGDLTARMLVAGQNHKIGPVAPLGLDPVCDPGGVPSPDRLGGALPVEVRPATTAYLVLVFRGFAHRYL